MDMNKKKLTVKDVLDLKGKRQLTEVFVSTAEEAAACEAAGIDLLVTMGGDMLRAVRDAAPNTFVTGALEYGKVVSATDAVKQAFDRWNAGADAIYARMSPEWLREMTKEGLPVVGHVGMVPQIRTWFGGFKAVGKTADEAMRVYRHTLAHQEAGAIGVEMEVVPARIASEISRRVKICVLSMGSGDGCDAQYLFACDVLGENAGHVPRHARVYANLRAELQRIQDLRIEAFRGYKKDVDAGSFSTPDNTVPLPDAEFEKFLLQVDGG
jgi:3-methyl-2-oxobutanoate hydroxymethyltransferase